ncbi:hypothetical protein B0T18DRAFT_431685 [Schizothecium vesticola]|uniref:Heterokaryon incompatibility domain-containing protein n=1 Tax=Schizothecium vesticola TaxID=314040 RepID=A0AA40EJ92_9PEZI|nr:hypothetical protein B0T18DRAFT_431685 [Schizothecium vesticola]
MTGMMRQARVAGRMVHARASLGENAVGEDGKKMARRWFSRREIVRVQRVCVNDWFQRIWTIQEMLLAPTTVFMLGRTECPASALYTYVLFAESLMDSDTRERMQFRMRSIVLEEVAKTGPRAVYGMLGMLKAFVPLEVHLPSVDYAKSLQDVFEEFAYHMMRTMGTLLPLEMILHASAEDLPSWVPDLRDASAVAWTPFRTGLKRYVWYNNEMYLPGEWQPGRLDVRARPLASVLEMFTRMPRFEKEKADKAKSSKDHFFVVNMYDGAALFLTECGLWGLCKGRVEPGDQVSQLMGVRFPFVLRSVGPASASEFRLVGTTDVAELEGPGQPNTWQTHLVEDEYFGITLV